MVSLVVLLSEGAANRSSFVPLPPKYCPPAGTAEDAAPLCSAPVLQKNFSSGEGEIDVFNPPPPNTLRASSSTEPDELFSCCSTSRSA